VNKSKEKKIETHPNFRWALYKGQNIKIRVTPEQSIEVQQIAFECGRKWKNGVIKIWKNGYPFLYVNKEEISYDDKLSNFEHDSAREFSFCDDCFVRAKPGKSKLQQIDDIMEKIKQTQVSSYVDEKTTFYDTIGNSLDEKELSGLEIQLQSIRRDLNELAGITEGDLE